MRRVLSSHSRSRRSARFRSRTDCAHVIGASVLASGSASNNRSRTDRWTVRSAGWGAIVARARRRECHGLDRIQAADLPVEVVLHFRVATQLIETAVQQAHRAGHRVARLPIFQLVDLYLLEQLFENRES